MTLLVPVRQHNSLRSWAVVSIAVGPGTAYVRTVSDTKERDEADLDMPKYKSASSRILWREKPFGQGSSRTL